MLIDSHCHLDFPEFSTELDAVVARARDAGVGAMVTIGTSLARFPGVRAVAERFPHVYCTVGVHPHEADREQTATDALVGHAAHPKVVGIGETGLDYYYEHSARSAQAANFRAHIAAARETGLPLIVHARDADEDVATMLRDEMGNGAYTGLIHCFSSGPALARPALDLGLYISISGIVTFKAAEELRRTVADIPVDRLLVETDAPYLSPAPNRGRRNEPSFVVHTAAQVAALKHLAAEELAARTTENFFRLFTRAQRPAA